MTQAALIVLPGLPPGEPESMPDGTGFDAPSVILSPPQSRVTRACTRVVLGGYALSVKIESASESLAHKLQARGMM